MISEFSTFGSSASRNIFNNTLNKDFDKQYSINFSVEMVNLISLMSKPVEADESLVNSSHDYDNTCVNQDLSKDFLDFLKNDTTVEYLIIDTFNDVEFSVIRLDGDTYITESNRLKKVEYYNLVKDKPKLNIHNDYDEYIEVWKQACDSFFEFLNNNRPDIRVILNMARLCYRYRDDDGEIAEDKSFKAKIKDNELRDVLDYYIIENYDVEVLKFGRDTLIDPNHIFGRHPTHYEANYFIQKNRQLSEIIQKNTLYDHDDIVNKKLRQIERRDLLFEREYKELKKED